MTKTSEVAFVMPRKLGGMLSQPLAVSAPKLPRSNPLNASRVNAALDELGSTGHYGVAVAGNRAVGPGGALRQHPKRCARS